MRVCVLVCARVSESAECILNVVFPLSSLKASMVLRFQIFWEGGLITVEGVLFGGNLFEIGYSYFELKTLCNQNVHLSKGSSLILD